MNAEHDRANAVAPDMPANEAASGKLEALPGEPGIPNVAASTLSPLSRKGLVAVAFVFVTVAAVAGMSVHRLATGGSKDRDDPASKRATDRPAASAVQPKKLELPQGPKPAAAASAPVARYAIPALIPTSEELAEPIGVRRTGTGGGSAANGGASEKAVRPEDAPVMVTTSRPGASHGSAGTTPGRSRPDAGTAVSGAGGSNEPNPLDETRRNLDAYQRQLQGLMDNLMQGTQAVAGGSTAGGVPSGGLPGPLLSAQAAAPATRGNTSAGGHASASTQSPGLFGGQLQSSATPRVAAGTLGNRSLTLPKGTAFTCALKTRVVSATSGMVGCQVLRNVYGDDGRVLLIERGSHLDGEYRIASVRPGTVRIPVLWTRIRTPHGVTVEIDSPGTGALGESGIDGYVDNRWGERMGAAMLLSLIDDSVKLVIQNQASEGDADTIVLPSTTANTSKLAEKVLDSTINIPPLVFQNQGGIVGIYVARHVDFSAVYELVPSSRESSP